MLSTEQRWLFIEVPGTGARSVREALLPIANEKSTPEDGLEDYAKRLNNLSSFTVFASICHPLERAVKCYFAPRRWMRKRDNGSTWRADCYWSTADFLTMLPEIRPMTAYLKLGSDAIYPGIRFLRFETLSADFSAVAKELKLRTRPVSPVLDGFDSEWMSKNVLADNRAKKAVTCAFAEDFEVFGYLS